MLDCCICGAAFRLLCIDISNSEARKIKQNAGMSWSCKRCASISADLNGLKAVIVSLQEEVAQLRSAVSSSSVVKPVLTMHDTEKITQEVFERTRRSTNLIIFGSKEEVAGSRKSQIDADAALVGELLDRLGVQRSAAVPVRLGRFDATRVELCRPIKIKLGSEECVSAAVSNARKLKSCERWNKISISRDRTPMQINYYKTVRDELNNRVSAGEANIKIKYVAGVPTIVSEN